MKRTLALTLFLLTLLFGAAFAQKTPAGTSITNTAQATYVDSNGANQTAQSNEVVTVVQKVYSLSITPNSSTAPSAANPNGEPAKTATTEFGQSTTGLSEGETFLYYTVTNTSNTKANETDQIILESIQGTLDDFNFTAVGIYQVTAFGAQPAANASTVASVALGANVGVNDVAFIAVKVKLPALTNADNNKVGHLDLKGSFNAAPTVSDINNWARVVAKRPNVTLTKTASKTAVVPGDTITYTLSGTNSGDTAAYAVSSVVTVGGTARSGLLITDVIPSGLSYVGGTATGSVTPTGTGTPLVLYSINGGSSWTTTQPTSGVNAVGLLVEGSGQFFTAGATYSLSFNVQVPANAAATTAYNNTATLRYDANNDGDSADTDETFTTPPVTSTVGAVYSVAVGPQGKPSAAEGGETLTGTGTYTDNGKVWNVTFSGAHNAATNAGKDAQTITSPVYTGDTVAFLNTIKNLSNAADTYTLTASSAQGYAVTLYQSNGATLLTGPTASVPAGGTLNVVVKVAVPVGGVADTVTLTATSTSNTSKSDVTLDKTPAPQTGFTFTPNASGTVTYSGSVTYTHTLTNNANTAATVRIPAPAITAPKGWTYTYSAGGNAYTPNSPLTVPANSSVTFTVTVTVPAPTAPAAFDAFVGQTETATITATATYSSSATGISASVTDTTTVIGGSLSLLKSVATYDGTKTAPTDCSVSTNRLDATGATAKPGDFLCYTIVSENRGNRLLQKVIVKDALNSFTDFVSVSANATTGASYGAGSTVLYSNDNTTWSPTATSVTLTAGQTVYVAVNTDGDAATITNTDTMPQNAKLTVTFVVKVK